MKSKRTVRTAEVTIETEERVVLRSAAQRSILMWCPDCHREVEMVAVEEAAQIAGVSPRTIYRQVEAGTVYCFEDSGRTFICAQTLPRRAASGRANELSDGPGRLVTGINGPTKF